MSVCYIILLRRLKGPVARERWHPRNGIILCPDLYYKATRYPRANMTTGMDSENNCGGGGQEKSTADTGTVLSLSLERKREHQCEPYSRGRQLSVHTGARPQLQCNRCSSWAGQPVTWLILFCFSFCCCNPTTHHPKLIIAAAPSQTGLRPKEFPTTRCAPQADRAVPTPGRQHTDSFNLASAAGPAHARMAHMLAGAAASSHAAMFTCSHSRCRCRLIQPLGGQLVCGRKAAQRIL